MHLTAVFVDFMAALLCRQNVTDRGKTYGLVDICQTNLNRLSNKRRVISIGLGGKGSHVLTQRKPKVRANLGRVLM